MAFSEQDLSSSAFAKRELLATLVSGTEITDERFAFLTADIVEPFGLAIGRPLPGSSQRAYDALASSLDFGCISVQSNGKLAILANYQNLASRYEENAASGAAALALTLPFSTQKSLLHQLDLVCSLAQQAGDGRSLNAKDHALSYLKTQIQDQVYLTDMLHPALEQLRVYDRENKSDLLHTLQVYLENDSNAQRCSKILFLHRNSLVYRLRRIREITGCNLADPEERAYLRLSFLLKN